LGGSRGLGELVAKIVAAGGGEVTLTYASGRDDAERICAEAHALERRCTARQLDIARLLDAPPEWLAQGNYSHVYFFASPAIAKSAGNRWNPVLFDKFAAVYVDAFARLAEIILGAAPANGAKPRFFYPSTIFLAQPEKDFVEYCVAKATGEALCQQLALRYGTVFFAPRLPRMRTDQTSGVQADMQDALPVMHEAVTEFQRLSV
jgi:NAD(P)-dependent dehydrogenase (short-subunit alcohol dehydrogenase family)